jgi:hypothetical protein
MEDDRRQECEQVLFVAPHDSRVELRSARQTPGSTMQRTLSAEASGTNLAGTAVQRMNVREDTHEALISAIGAAPRALVFLSVPWSHPEREARADFYSAAKHLEPRVQCFVVDEEAEPVRRWLSSVGVPPISEKAALGAGSVLWVEHGRVIAVEIAGHRLRASGILAKADELW